MICSVSSGTVSDVGGQNLSLETWTRHTPSKIQFGEAQGTMLPHQRADPGVSLEFDGCTELKAASIDA